MQRIDRMPKWYVHMNVFLYFNQVVSQGPFNSKKNHKNGSILDWEMIKSIFKIHTTIFDLIDLADNLYAYLVQINQTYQVKKIPTRIGPISALLRGEGVIDLA